MENKGNRWFYNTTEKEWKTKKTELFKIIIRSEVDGDEIKFKSIFKDSKFGKRKNKIDRDKVKENDFYTMKYDNSKAKDMVCNHSVCYTPKDELNTVKKMIKDMFPNASFKNTSPKTLSIGINPQKVLRGDWVGKDEDLHTQFPISIISYKRANGYGKTHKYLTECKIPHYLFVEEDEYDEYEKWYDKMFCCLVKGMNYSKEDMGSTPMRNFILNYWNDKGVKRVWLLDDNIISYKRLYQGGKNIIKSVEIFKSIEKYIINYDNVGLVSHNYNPFISEGDARTCIVKNGKGFSSMLIKTDPEIRFKYKYNEDHLISMEYIEKGYCNLCFNNVVYDKNQSGCDKGGNREGLYKCKDNEKDGEGYKEKYEYFKNIIDDLCENGELTLIDGAKPSSLVSRSKTMKGKVFHAEVNYKILAKNEINDIKKVDNKKYTAELYFIQNENSSETSSQVSFDEEEEEVEEEPEEVEEKDKKILYIINNFIDRKKALEDEEKELKRLFPDYF